MAAELRGTNVLVNAMCPGWVRTDMGGTRPVPLKRALTQVSQTDFQAMLQQWGLPEAVASDLAHEYGAIGDGHPAFSTPRDTVPRLTGRPARSVEDFARDYANQLTTPPQWNFGQS